MGAILGGLFNSRLNMKLREEKGYTYGAGAGFDLRRAAGPVRRSRRRQHRGHRRRRSATLLAELDRIRDGAGHRRRARAARDFLVGVFPLRFETPGPVVGALAGLVVHELPDDELTRYRERIEAVTADDVLAAARRTSTSSRPRSCSSATPTRSAPSLEAAGFGPVEVDPRRRRDRRGLMRPALARTGIARTVIPGPNRADARPDPAESA